jgi:hypothetical protein
MTQDPVLHALIDLCQAIAKKGPTVLSDDAKSAYARALDVIRENTAPGGERTPYVSVPPSEGEPETPAAIQKAIFAHQAAIERLYAKLIGDQRKGVSSPTISHSPMKGE